MTEDWTASTPEKRRERQRVALGELISALEAARASGEWSRERVEQVARLVRSAHDAGLSPESIALEADMSINEVRDFLELPSARPGAFDWRILSFEQPQSPRGSS